MGKKINIYLKEQIKAIEELQKEEEVIQKIFSVLKTARDRNGKIFLMGNGGSASTASHFTADLLKTSILKKEKRFKSICLSDNTPVLLAWSNDSSYDDVFIGQLENFLEKNDVVIGISGSGNSLNVIKAIEFAKKNNNSTISLTGKGGGKLSKISKINLTVKSDDMLTIESIHLLICHTITTLLRKDGEPLFSY